MSSQLGPSVSIRPLLSSQSAFPSSMQIEWPIRCPFASFPVSELPMQDAEDKPTDELPTTREYRGPQQKQSNCSSIKFMYLTSFFQTLIPLRDLLTVMTSLLHIVQSLGAVNCKHTSVDELLLMIAGFGRRIHDWLTNSHR